MGGAAGAAGGWERLPAARGCRHDLRVFEVTVVKAFQFAQLMAVVALVALMLATHISSIH